VQHVPETRYDASASGDLDGQSPGLDDEATRATHEIKLNRDS
jgi:hypothetical protein